MNMHFWSLDWLLLGKKSASASAYVNAWIGLQLLADDAMPGAHGSMRFERFTKVPAKSMLNDYGIFKCMAGAMWPSIASCNLAMGSFQPVMRDPLPH